MLRQESVPAVTFLAEACRSLSDWPSGRTVTCAPHRCSSDPEASGPLLAQACTAGLPSLKTNRTPPLMRSYLSPSPPIIRLLEELFVHATYTIPPAHSLTHSKPACLPDLFL